MTRADLFQAIKPFAPQGRFTAAHVAAIDALADSFSLPVINVMGSMQPSPAALNLMHEFEGLRLEAYPDPGSADGNPWTIGRGSTGPGISKGVKWTQAQADERFAADVTSFAAGVSKALDGAKTTQPQFDAMVSLAYNIGLGAFSSSTLLKMHKAGDFRGARGQFQRWNKNAGKEMAGLTRRRSAEATLYGS